MGIFGFLKRSRKNEEQTEKTVEAQSGLEQLLSSYVVTFGEEVVTFDERKKTCIPSSRGLYVAEILLLDYCSKGVFPNSRGYSSFWWYLYGIKNVDDALTSLEKRGFIRLGNAQESIFRLRVEELKEVLEDHGLTVSGKKSELIERINNNISENELINAGVERVYILTDIGKKELEENAYVPYMHSFRDKTNEGLDFGKEFNIWSINRLLGAGDKSNWKEIVDHEYQELLEDRKKKQKERDEKELEKIESYKESNPEYYKKQMELYKKNKEQEKKMEAARVAREQIVTFEERKQTCIPSSRGLYVAEILLLDYCAKGDYPNPSKGYPSFWWYKYGIKNVDDILKSLEERGFVRLGEARESLSGLTGAKLKEILKNNGLPVSGKKSELVNRIKENVTEENMINSGIERKYVLTAKGEKELQENAYVPYMHKHPHQTMEGSFFGKEFNVWSINRLLANGDKSNWKEIVEHEDQELLADQDRRKKENDERRVEYIESYKERDPKYYKSLMEEYNKGKDIDRKIKAINDAENKYKEDKDTDSYIKFWEGMWKEGGLEFYSRTFTLADLYIKEKRYDEALKFVEKIKSDTEIGVKEGKLNEIQLDKVKMAGRYIKKIEKLKAKGK